MSFLPKVRKNNSLPSPARGRGKTVFPRNRVWSWKRISLPQQVLVTGDPGYDEEIYFKRTTPVGLTEQEMLSTVNYLDEEALCEFPGVGPTTAKNIIKWRHQNHYFSSLDEVIQIPRIGEKKFLDITGRENLLDQFPLHDLMRTSRRFDIRFTDLSPWKNPAPGIARIILDDHETDTPHLIECARRDLHLISRKVLQWKLHFYLTNEHPEGRALYLLKKLPHLLRKVLRQRNKTKSLIS